MLGRDKLGIEVRDAERGDPRIAAEPARPISPAESMRARELAALATTDEEGAAMVDSKALLGFGPKVSGFDERLESYATDKGWFTEPPQKATKRWFAQGLDRDHRRDRAIVIARSTCRAMAWCSSAGRSSIAGRGHAAHCAGDAGAHAVGRGHPGDARRVPADAAEDARDVAIDGPGGRVEGCCRGSRRRTRPWSGAWRSVCGSDVEDVLDRTASDLQPVVPSHRSPTCPTGTGRAAGAPADPAAGAASRQGCSRVRQSRISAA